MSSRERWTIYPLVFLSLAVSLRTRMESIDPRRDLQCGSVAIVNKAGKTVARVSSDAERGRLEFYGADGKIVLFTGVDHTGTAGELGIQKVDGTRQLRIGSTGQSGVVEVFGANGLPQLIEQATPGGGLLLTFSSDGKLVRPFGFPQLKAVTPVQPEQTPAPEVQPPEPMPEQAPAPEAPATPAASE